MCFRGGRAEAQFGVSCERGRGAAMSWEELVAIWLNVDLAFVGAAVVITRTCTWMEKKQVPER